MISAVGELLFFVCSCVLGGFALWGWRRSASTGALLIAIGCGVRALGELAYVWQLSRLYTGGPSSYAQTVLLFGAFGTAGALISNVLLIVGLALILRRLPAAKR